MYGVLPGPWCPRISASDHMCCDKFMPSIPELLNSGMLAGPCTYGGVLLPVFRVGSSPTSIPEFRNSGFSTRASLVLAECLPMCSHVVQRAAPLSSEGPEFTIGAIDCVPDWGIADCTIWQPFPAICAWEDMVPTAFAPSSTGSSSSS